MIPICAFAIVAGISSFSLVWPAYGLAAALISAPFAGSLAATVAAIINAIQEESTSHPVTMLEWHRRGHSRG